MGKPRQKPTADRIGTLRASLKWLEHPAAHDAFRDDPAQYRWLENCIVRLRELIDWETDGKEADCGALLEACKQIVWKLGHNHMVDGKCVPGTIDRNDATVRMAIEAIAKAEGTDT